MDDLEVFGLLFFGDGFDWGWGLEIFVFILGFELVVFVFCCEVDLAMVVDVVFGLEFIFIILVVGGIVGFIYG